MNNKAVKVQLIIECQVSMNEDDVERNFVKEFGSKPTDQELRQRLLFAYLNPKIETLNDEAFIEGAWDNICDFSGKFSGFRLKI